MNVGSIYYFATFAAEASERKVIINKSNDYAVMFKEKKNNYMLIPHKNLILYLVSSLCRCGNESNSAPHFITVDAASLYMLGSGDVQLYEVKAFEEDFHSWFVGQTVQRGLCHYCVILHKWSINVFLWHNTLSEECFCQGAPSLPTPNTTCMTCMCKSFLVLTNNID